jgi:hypothetical protein
VRAFFEGSVRGDWEALGRLASGDARPHVTVHAFGKLWP